MIRLSIVVLFLLLAGCVTNVKTHAVRGGSGIEIDCSGLGVGWGKCYERAALECRAGGYLVITKSSDARDEEGDYPFGWNPAGYLTRTMLVVCR
ncbi:hypothetical protein NJH78_13830 [Pseudomonas chlororaphis]|uniref:hypothetical protein n=1 Tax=Pseudomonas chlororaphis TaxID=587753 RepID=UPI00209B9AB3|nr:hypothetical protein [Pseudomonas chlororaphis]MCO7571057.1 hypothetical protein [Pseudomonas chlororaphis]MCO7589143.1 hypothetical protein [Pseudomonas chlororaphis]MCO7612272.1 hypothetical protein [Pseudomonas chlororaphis]